MPDDMKNTTGVLRQARIKTGVEGQDTRLAGDRQKHLSRGSFINYYDDLGFTATAEGANQFRQKQSEFSEQLSTAQQGAADYKRNIDSASGVLQGAKKKYGTYDKFVSSNWDKLKDTFVNVRVVDSKNNIEATYKLPKEAAEELAKEKGLYTLYNPDGNWMNVATKTKGKGPMGGRTVGKELHEAFMSSEKDIYNQWYEKSTPTLLESWKMAQKQIAEGEKTLGTAKANLSVANTDIKLAQNQNAFSWQQLKDDYQRKKSAMAEVLSKMNFEEA
jgi:hypothetical protein